MIDPVSLLVGVALGAGLMFTAMLLVMTACEGGDEEE